jgi:hypothetical protein
VLVLAAMFDAAPLRAPLREYRIHPVSLSITHIVVLSRYVFHGRYREDASIRAI